jgi:hypothetical protein
VEDDGAMMVTTAVESSMMVMVMVMVTAMGSSNCAQRVTPHRS